MYKKIREKTDDARTLKGKILNFDFLLTVWINWHLWTVGGHCSSYTNGSSLTTWKIWLIHKGHQTDEGHGSNLDHKKCGVICEGEKNICGQQTMLTRKVWRKIELGPYLF